MIGIVGALDTEIDHFKKELQNVEVKNYAGLLFFQGIIDNKLVVVVKGGIGKVNATMATQLLIDKYGCQLVINSGIAGALDKSLSVLDAIGAKSVTQYDLNYEFIDLDVTRVNIKKKYLDIIEKLNIKAVDTTTGDTFITSDISEEVVTTTKAHACDMEGGAVAFVCKMNNVDVVILRVISDMCTEDEYQEFEQEAASISIENTIKFLKQL